jgi:hypothetical protein
MMTPIPKIVLFCVALVVSVGACVGPERSRTVSERPTFPEGILSARWGSSVDEVKQASEKDGNRWFQDSTDKTPYVLYASGAYFNEPAVYTYFFTPKSKKLYRVDVTFNELRMFEQARNFLIQQFKEPEFSEQDVAHWSWRDNCLIILQRDATQVQISYSSGPFLKVNHRETR